MNLLLVTQGYPYGESERGFLPTELEALRRQCQVTLLAFDNGEPLLYPPAEDVAYSRYSWPVKISLPQLFAQLRFAEVRADLWRAIRSEKANLHNVSARIVTYSLRAQQIRALLRSVIRERHIDVVYTYWCVQATVAALRLKKEFPSLKVVTRFHGADLYREQAPFACQPLRPFIAAGCDHGNAHRIGFHDGYGQTFRFRCRDEELRLRLAIGLRQPRVGHMAVERTADVGMRRL